MNDYRDGECFLQGGEDTYFIAGFAEVAVSFDQQPSFDTSLLSRIGLVIGLNVVLGLGLTFVALMIMVM